MGVRSLRRKRRQADMAESRIVNGHRKRKERQRRDERMLELLDKGQLPYTPPVMSWLTVKLGKPAARITPEDVQALKTSAAANSR